MELIGRRGGVGDGGCRVSRGSLGSSNGCVARVSYVGCVERVIGSEENIGGEDDSRRDDLLGLDRGVPSTMDISPIGPNVDPLDLDLSSASSTLLSLSSSSSYPSGPCSLSSKLSWYSSWCSWSEIDPSSSSLHDEPPYSEEESMNEGDVSHRAVVETASLSSALAARSRCRVDSGDI